MRIGKTRRDTVPNLGALELAVLKRLWELPGQIDARTMHAELAGREITLSTVQATLERLSRKGLAIREKLSRAYFYRAAVTREQLIARLFGDVARRLTEGELEPAISGFIDLIGESNPKLLEQVEDSARRRRKGQ